MTALQPLVGFSVLLLEDSYFIAEESQWTLETAGARVLGPCRDLAETLAALRGAHPDCALVDINLGNGPTFEPARALRAAGVTVILATGYDPSIIPEDLQGAIYLQKPIDPRQLIRAVVGACMRH